MNIKSSFINNLLWVFSRYYSILLLKLDFWSRVFRSFVRGGGGKRGMYDLN
jgi:hypothetical protein